MWSCRFTQMCTCQVDLDWVRAVYGTDMGHPLATNPGLEWTASALVLNNWGTRKDCKIWSGCFITNIPRTLVTEILPCICIVLNVSNQCAELCVYSLVSHWQPIYHFEFRTNIIGQRSFTWFVHLMTRKKLQFKLQRPNVKKGEPRADRYQSYWQYDWKSQILYLISPLIQPLDYGYSVLWLSCHDKSIARGLRWFLSD